METDAVTKLAQMHDGNAVGRFLSRASEFTDSCVVALAETPKQRGNPDYPRMFAFSGDPGVAERMSFLYLDGLLPEGGFLFDAFGVVHVDDKPVLMHDAIHEAVDRAMAPLEQLQGPSGILVLASCGEIPGFPGASRGLVRTLGNPLAAYSALEFRMRSAT